MGMNYEDCINYSYDDDYECYTCLVSLDEDELRRFILGEFNNCPYYRSGDDYSIVRKQN